MKHIISLFFLLISYTAIADTGVGTPGTEIIYNPRTGDYLEVKPEKDGIVITGKNLKTGQTWVKHNKNNGEVYGYDESNQLYYGDRNSHTLVKFPAYNPDK